MTRAREPRAKPIFVGDWVERVGGVYDGLVGRVTACKPKHSPWTSHIKVDVDIEQFTGRRLREKVRLLTGQWSSVASWKVIDNPQ